MNKVVNESKQQKIFKGTSQILRKYIVDNDTAITKNSSNVFLTLISSLVVLTPLALAQPVFAQNAYAKQQLNQTNTGGFINLPVGQADLFPPNPDPTKKAFITDVVVSARW